jgi:hypothetical protein
MTATTATPLETLAQQITRQQRELEALRQEYETRQTRLTDLTRRKEELTAQLQQVEADIRATMQDSSQRRAAVPTNAPQAQPAPRTPATPSPARSAPPVPQPPSPRAQTLPALLVEIVRQATEPVTVKQLAEEVVRRKFPTTTGNLRKLVGIKVGLLVNKGLLRRAPDQAGVLPAKRAPGLKTTPGNVTPAAKTRNTNGRGDRKTMPPAKADGQSKPLSLRATLADVLAKSRRPLAARELAEQALASGYTTKSKNFIDVIWVALGQMDNVENVPGKGWRLIKR